MPFNTVSCLVLYRCLVFKNRRHHTLFFSNNLLPGIFLFFGILFFGILFLGIFFRYFHEII